MDITRALGYANGDNQQLFVAPQPIRDRREREEQDYGLAELDGQLPWLGKKRRK